MNYELIKKGRNDMGKKLKWKCVLVVAIAALAIWLSHPPLDVMDNEGNEMEIFVFIGALDHL